MKKFYVTFVKSFTLEVEAKSEDDAEERAEYLLERMEETPSSLEFTDWEITDVVDDSDEDDA